MFWSENNCFNLWYGENILGRKLKWKYDVYGKGKTACIQVLMAVAKALFGMVIGEWLALLGVDDWNG